MRHRRSSMPNVAKKAPVTTNIRSPRKPCVPMVVSASPPITTSPPTMVSAPRMREAVSGSFSTNAASRMPNSAAQDGWITPAWASGTSRKPE